MWFGRDQDSAYDLEAKAHGLLDAGRTDEARAIAEQLLSMGWSGGFEVKALAQQQAGELPGAIATLEEAVSKVPNLWHLWQLLGNLRSDAGDLDGALEALNQALLAFGRALWRERAPYARLAETVNAVAEAQPLVRRLLGPVWDLART